MGYDFVTEGRTSDSSNSNEIVHSINTTTDQKEKLRLIKQLASAVAQLSQDQRVGIVPPRWLL
jgi:hypothetical protein